MCFDMFEDEAGDTSISDVPGDEHPPDLRSFFIKRPMCAHANGTSRGESNEVGSSRLCGRVGRRGRCWVVKLWVQQLSNETIRHGAAVGERAGSLSGCRGADAPADLVPAGSGDSLIAHHRDSEVSLSALRRARVNCSGSSIQMECPALRIVSSRAFGIFVTSFGQNVGPKST